MGSRRQRSREIKFRAWKLSGELDKEDEILIAVLIKAIALRGPRGHAVMCLLRWRNDNCVRNVLGGG